VHEWLSLKEAAHYLRVSRRTMYNLMDRGVLRWHEIPGLRGRWFKREELDALRQPS
jgi:excisionase family DNA binding protein